MKLNVYAVLDNAAGAFLPPFFMHNHAVAIRAFAQAVNDSDHQFSKSSNDYCLYCIGSFDDVNGVLIPAEKFDNLGIAITFKELALTF